MNNTRKSFASVARKIRNLGTRGPEILGPGLRQIGEEIKTDVAASRPGAGVPRDEGVLASTLSVVGPIQAGGVVKVELVAGGPSAVYALVQHERLDYRHTLGEARYWIRGLERWRPGGSAAIQALRENAEAAIRKASKS